MRLAVYARLSRAKSEDDTTIDRQLAACRAWADRNDGQIGVVYVDSDHSASNGGPRPEFERLLTDITDPARGRQGVVVYRLDRLFRDPYDYGRIWRATQTAGVAVHATDGISSDDPDAPIRLAIGLGLGHNEARTISIRTRAALAAKAAQGQVHGGGARPFGYRRIPGGLVPHPEEAPVVRELYARALAGEPLGLLARELYARGITGTGGWRLRAQDLTRILSNPVHAGLRAHHGDIVAEGDWPALVDRADWETLAAMTTARKTGPRPPRTYLLSGLLYCGLCDAGICGRPRTTKTGRSERRYACVAPPHGPGCGRVTIAADPAEAIVAAAVLAELARPETQAAIRAAASSDSDAETARRIRELEARRGELADLVADGTLSAAEVRPRAAQLAAEVAGLRARLGVRSRAAALAEAAGDPDALAAGWEARTFGQRVALVGAVVERVVLRPASRPSCRVDPARLAIRFRG